MKTGLQSGEEMEAGSFHDGCVPEGEGPCRTGGQGLLDGIASWGAFSLWVGAGWLLMDDRTEDQESGEPHLSVLSYKTPNPLNSISLEPPTSGLMGGGIEGLFDFLTSS